MAISIRLPDDIEARLNKLAAKTGRTKSFYIREAIAEHVVDLEDYYLAEKVVERIRHGKERTYTSDEVEKLLGLED
ncbi:MAG: type II toxin-antitoxin system RelB family antitoxin [Burkholderiales bacterium]